MEMCFHIIQVCIDAFQRMNPFDINDSHFLECHLHDKLYISFTRPPEKLNKMSISAAGGFCLSWKSDQSYLK